MKKTQKLNQIEVFISELIEKEISNQELAGASISITHKSQEILRKNYGYANIEMKRPIDNHTIFRLYSMSKPIAAVATMILLERGKIDLLTPVSDYISSFKNMKVNTKNGLVKVNREIIIKDLLNMTSGIVYPDDDSPGQALGSLFDHIQGEIKAGKQTSTLELCDLVAKQPLAFQPGERWRYGFNTDIMGAIIELVSGKTLGEFYNLEIFESLHMIDTGFYVPLEKQDQLAELYSYIETDGSHRLLPEDSRHLCLTKGLEPPLFESAGAGLLSTMDDYTKFTNMLLNGGNYKDVHIIGRKFIELFANNQLTKKQRNTIYFDNLKGYGYSNFMRVFMDSAHGENIGSVGEFGWDGWSGSYFTVNPVEEFSIKLMVQRCGYSNPTLIRKLRNIAYSML